jgi:hypothetical protein
VDNLEGQGYCRRCERITNQKLLDRNNELCGFCACEYESLQATIRHERLEREDPKPILRFWRR